MKENTLPVLGAGELNGFRPFKRPTDPKYLAKLRTHQRVMEALINGSEHPAVIMYKLQETQTISDFPLLMADTLDRLLLAGYAEGSYSWTQIAKLSTIRDFREAKRYAIDGAEGPLDKVKELEQYPAAALTETLYTLQLEKYGARMPFSWELIINDDLGAFTDIPMRFGKRARRTEQRIVTTLYANNTLFFKTANKNVVTGNPVLSVPGIQAALTQMALQTDVDGDPIVVDGVTLVVPTALEMTAQNILNAIQFWLNDGGGTTTERMIVGNFLRGKLTIAVDEYLGTIDTVHGATGWYIFANPNSGRPAIEAARLRGQEAPALFMKSPNAVRVGGGPANPFDGDFDTDSLQYKVRHCFAAALQDPKMAVYSNGSGS